MTWRERWRRAIAPTLAAENARDSLSARLSCSLHLCLLPWPRIEMERPSAFVSAMSAPDQRQCVRISNIPPHFTIADMRAFFSRCVAQSNEFLCGSSHLIFPTLSFVETGKVQQFHIRSCPRPAPSSPAASSPAPTIAGRTGLYIPIVRRPPLPQQAFAVRRRFFPLISRQKMGLTSIRPPCDRRLLCHRASHREPRVIWRKTKTRWRDVFAFSDRCAQGLHSGFN